MLRTLLLFTLSTTSVVGQTTFTWNNSAPSWGMAGSWTPSTGVPGNAITDLADFNPHVGIDGTFLQPDIASAFAFQSLTIANRWDLGNNTFTGSGSLSLSAGNTGGTLQLRGTGVTTFNGPSLAGTSPSNLALLNIGSSTTLQLTGATVANANLGNATVYGNLLVDNATTNLTTRLSFGANKLQLQGGGRFTLNANLEGGTVAVNGTNSGQFLSFRSGESTVAIRLAGTPTGQTILSFGGFERFNPGATINFTLDAPIGVTLGGAAATDPLIRFLQQTNLTDGALLRANTSGAQGNATALAFINGTDFAAWNAARQTIVAVSATARNSSTISGSTGNVSFTPNASGTTNLTADVSTTSLKLNVTSASETTLNLGTFSLRTTGLLLSGANNYAITGTGNLFDNTGGTGNRNIYVTQAATVLSVSVSVPTVFNLVITKSGAGVLALTGSADQVNVSGSAIYLNEGVLRAALGTNFGTNNIVQLRGGILEINNGATFARALGSAAGNVNWDTGGGNGGGGGFSAISQNATVNIGSGATLTWGQANFVQDGFALKFGSIASDRILTWSNDLALDSGAGAYNVREINVTRGTGSDLTRFVGLISGSTSTDLLKTGTGTLVLARADGNSYAGDTLVSSGTLQVSNTNSATSATGTGNVTIGNGGTLTGSGFIRTNSNKTLTIIAGGTLAPTDLTVQSSVRLNDGAIFAWSSETASQLHVTGTGNTLTAGTIIFAIREQSQTFVNGNSYQWLIADTQGTPTVTSVIFDLSNAPDYAAYGGTSSLSLTSQNGNLYLNFTATPEPTFMLMLAAFVGFVNSRRRSS